MKEFSVLNKFDNSALDFLFFSLALFLNQSGGQCLLTFFKKEHPITQKLQKTVAKIEDF
jgi:hypothetical protein